MMQPNGKADQSSLRAVADGFRRFAHGASSAVGSPWAFLIAVAALVVWACFGPRAHYSDTWQLVINTGTTIVTFLMVFLIQNTQNRDARAIHLKLDELIRVQLGAHNALLDLEEMTDDQLAVFRDRYQKLAGEARERLKRGDVDTDEAEIIEPN